MGMGKRVPEHALTAAERKLLSSCLQEARRSIHADYEKAPAQFKALFLYIEREIFSPEFTIRAARDAANFRSNSYTTRFYKITSKRPRDYVEHHRILTAQKIIKHTDVYHWQVGSMVGFSSPSVFSRSYKKVVGYPPNKEPKSEHCGNSARPGIQQAIVPTPVAGPGNLDPRVSATTAEISAGSSSLNLGKFWADIQGMPRFAIKNYALAHMMTVDVGHFYYLLEKAKTETRRNRARGKELCLAALDTLKLVEFWSGNEYPDEKALGYSSLANIYKLEFDLDAAGSWFGLADRFLPREPGEKPLLFAQVNLLRVSFLWCRRNTQAAILLLNDITPVIRQQGSYELLARTLLLHAEIYDSCGHPDRALPFLTEAVDLERFIDDPHVVFSAHFNRALVYTRLAMPAEAIAAFQVVKNLFKSVAGEISRFYISHLQGSVSRVNKDLRQAEILFLEAREGFLTEGLDFFGALVALELALVYLELGQPAKALLAATDAIPILSRYSSSQEAIGALSLLEEANKAQSVDKAIVKRVMRKLDLVRKAPSAPLLRQVWGECRNTHPCCVQQLVTLNQWDRCAGCNHLRG